MSGNDDLNKKFKDLLESLKTYAKNYVKDLVPQPVKDLFKKTDLKPHYKIIGIAVGVSLIFGMVIGVGVYKLKSMPQSASAAPGSAEKKGIFSFLDGFFGKKAPVFHLEKDGSYIFSNFESNEQFDGWEKMSARMTPSTNYAIEGTWSAQVTFIGGKEIAAITLEEMGRTRSRPTDWKDFESFQFYVFHPGTQTEYLTFMATDLWGKQYQETLNVPPGIWAKMSISVDKLATMINVESVNQISISRREPGPGLDFYFDDFRIIPVGFGANRLATERSTDYGFALQKAAWSAMDPQINGDVVRIPFVLKNETQAFCQLCPAEGGIPLPMGELRHTANVRLRNARGEDLPFQSNVLAYWPDRSIKWLSINFQATLPAFQGTGFFLEYSPKVQRMDFKSPLNVAENDTQIAVNTGVMQVLLNKKSFHLFESVAVDKNLNHVIDPGEVVSEHAKLFLNAKGKEYVTNLDRETYQVVLEEQGPERVVIRASGWYQSEAGERFCQAIVRYYFYVHKSYFKIAHTLVYTGYPANLHYQVYKSLQLPENETIEDFGITIPFAFSTARDDQAVAGLNHQTSLGVNSVGKLRILQTDYERALLKQEPDTVPLQDSLAGWFDVSNDKNGLGVALRHLRENFPKAFTADRDNGYLKIDLWPAEVGALDFQTTATAIGDDDYGRGNAFGIAKTHELLLYFHDGKTSSTEAMKQLVGFAERLIIRTNPYWVQASGVLGYLMPADPKYGTPEKMLDDLFNWALRHPKKFQWYGMLNFGDTLTWWRPQGAKAESSDAEQEALSRAASASGKEVWGWHPSGRWGWYNCEGVGLHMGSLLQFVRTGEWKYFEFGENSARHLMDIDTVHFDTVAHDSRLKNKISEKYSKVGAIHRHSGDHWSGRTDESSHTSVVGILLYYYLTADERALEVAKEIGEFFLTEPFTYVDRPDMAPNRALSNALWGDVLLYQQTWDQRYKAAAEKIVKIFLKGQQQDGSFLENYNPLFGTWSGEKHELYMTGYLVGALIAYHELTQDAATKDMFLRLVRYLALLEYSGPATLHGIAYAYHITKDPFFIAAAEQNLNKLLANQQKGEDPMLNGLIYDKPIYHRPMAFLSTVPYVFGAFEENFKRKEGGVGPASA